MTHQRIRKITAEELIELQELNGNYVKAYDKLHHISETLLKFKEDLLAQHGFDYETFFIDLETGEIKNRSNRRLGLS